jgi:hypothetical protein
VRPAEFQMNPSRREMLRFVYAEYWRGWIFQIYFSVVAIMLWGVLPRIEQSTDSPEAARDLLGVLALALTVFIFWLGWVVAAGRFRNLAEEANARYRIDEAGFARVSDWGQFQVSWKGITTVRESRRYIRLETRSWSTLVVFKRLLPADVLSLIRDLVRESSVPKKQLWPERSMTGL